MNFDKKKKLKRIEMKTNQKLSFSRCSKRLQRVYCRTEATDTILDSNASARRYLQF